MQERDGALAAMTALLEGAVRVKKWWAARGDAGPTLQDALQDLGVSAWIERVPKACDLKSPLVSDSLKESWPVGKPVAGLTGVAGHGGV